MLTIQPPSAEVVARFLAAQQGLLLTYEVAGMTREPVPPPGYNANHLRRYLGNGPEVFERAVAAVCSWAMFRQGWVRLESELRPPELGAVVAVIVRFGPMWWWNGCRVVLLINDTDPMRRVGFAYGTLPSHAERGEERFCVEMDAEGDVWYDLLAYSRPRHWLARIGYPLTRAMQRRFAAGSAAAMERAVADKHD